MTHRLPSFFAARLFLAALVALPPATVQARKPIDPVDARPASNPGDWVVTDDYPASALRDEKEGTVRFRLTVAPDGAPSGCEIVQSSGTPDLDNQTCTLLMERARFSPAMDRNGKPVEGTYTSSVRWVIPRTEQPPEAGLLEVTYLVGVDGAVSDCKVTRSEGVIIEKLKRDAAGPCGVLPTYEPYRDAQGNPVARRVIMRASTTVEAP